MSKLFTVSKKFVAQSFPGGHSKTGTTLAIYCGMKTPNQKLEDLRRRADRAYRRGDKEGARKLREQVDALITKMIKERKIGHLDFEAGAGPDEDAE